MTTDLEKDREAFEAWAKPRHYWLERMAAAPDQYSNTETQNVFSCWQARAALAAPAASIASWEMMPTDEMVIRGAETLHDETRTLGFDWDADLQGTQHQQRVVEVVFRSMIAAAAQTEPETIEEIHRCERERPYAPVLPADPTLPQEQPSDEELMRVFREACEHADHCNQGFSYGRAQALRAVFNLARYGAAPQAGEDAAGQVEHLDVENHRLRRAMRKIMARLTDLLDEDQFGNIESIVKEAGVEPPEPAGEDAQPVGIAGTMPGTSGFTMACFKASDVPLGTKLYATPQPAGRDAREVPDEP